MEIKQGNLKPDLVLVLEMRDPAEPDDDTAFIPIPQSILDDVVSVTMDMRPKGGGDLVITGATCSLDPVTAIVTHVWAAGETDHPVQKYDVEIDLEYPSGAIQTVPSKKFHTVEITEALNP